MKNLYSKILNRGLAALIALVLAVSGIPVTALAENEHAPDDYEYATSGVTVSGDKAEEVEGEQDEADYPDPDDENNDDTLLLESGGDESCVCTAFQSDPDCPVCVDDATQCAFYYCVCEALCGGDSINTDCPVCTEDYISCVMAVEVPEVEALADSSVNTYTALQDVMSTAGTATITLTGNITDGTSQLTVNGTKTLDLAGNDLTITLDDIIGKNSNGIKIASGATLTIKDSGTGGKLIAKNNTTSRASDYNGAGINTADGTLIILGGIIEAKGGGDIICGGAGIGGGEAGTYGTIIISGGTVTATGNDWGAGIGSSSYANNGSSSITITGDAVVTATGGDWGAGIGAGGGADGGKITIENNTDGSPKVLAIGGLDAAGIGGGYNGGSGGGGSGIIEISGGTVEAICGVKDKGETQMAIGKGDGGNYSPISITGDYDYWTNTTNSAPAEKTGSGTFTNSETYKYVKLVEKTGVAVTGVTLNKSSTALTVGGTETLTATVAPENATDKSISWSSSNTSVATVDSNGVVTAVASGTATITVTTTDGSKTDTCTVTVKANQAALSINAVTGKTYGDAAFQLSTSGGSGSGAVTYTCVSGPGSVTPGGSVTITGAGNIIVYATKAGDTNYNETTSANLTIAVSKATLTPSINLASASGKTYNGTTAVSGSPAISLSGAVNSEAPAATATFAFADANAGNNKTVNATSIALSGTWGNNYALSITSLNNVASSLSVTPAPLTISGFSISKKYNGTTAVSSFGTLSFNGLVNSETATVNATGVTATYNDANVGTGKAIAFSGNFSMTGGTATASNYSITQPTGITGTITVADVSNTGGTATVTYSGSTIDLTSVSGLFTVDSNAGARTYTVDTGGTGEGNITGNTLTVTKAGTLTIGLTTAATATHAAGGKVTGTLTVNKGSQNAPAAPTSTAKTDTSVTLTANSAMEFSKDGTNWQTSNVFSGLTANTTYSFYQRLAATDLYNASSASSALSVTTDKTAVTGTPTITISGGTLKIDALLEASTSTMTPNSGYTYQWKANDTPISGATSSSYTVQGSDVGKTITVTVTTTDSNYTGSATSTATAAVPYTIVIQGYSNGDNDDFITANEVYQASGTPATIAYILDNTHLENKLVLSIGSTAIQTITTPGTSTYDYTVNATDATNGVITITAAFSHSSVLTSATVSLTAPAKGQAPQDATTTESNYTITETDWSGSLTTGGKFAGSTVYTATITLTATSPATFDSDFSPTVTTVGGTVDNVNVASGGGSVTFTVTYPALPAKEVVSIAVTTEPTQTTYYSGDTLDLAGLVVTATYDDGTTGTVTPSGYSIDGTAVTSGTTVMTNAAHHGKTVTVAYGDKTAATTTLTVNKLTVQIGTITGNAGTDAVSVSGTYDVDETATISYTLANTAIVNSLTLGNGLSVITTPATSTVSYAVNAAHASSGTITFNPIFSHVSTLTSTNLSVTAPAKAATPQSTITADTYYTGEISWNGTPSVFLGDTIYSASITLTAKGGATFASGFAPTVNGGTVSNVVVASGGGSVTFTVTFPKTLARVVSGISIVTQPKLIYAASNKYSINSSIDKLDLSALVVKVTYDDTTTENIAYNNAGLTYKISGTTVINDKTAMTSAYNDEPIEVTYSSKTAVTNDLTVYAPPSLQISVSEVGINSAKITYAITQGSNATTSKLQRRNGNSWVDVTDASSPYTASGLTADTSYEYRIWAKDNVTNREYASPYTFQTSPIEKPPGFTVSGTVTDNGPPPPASITVAIERGNTRIASVVVAGSGTYDFSFTDLPNGIYNLVSDNGSYKVTRAVTVTGLDVTGIIINMDTGKTQSIIDIVTADTPPAAVDGLPDLFDDNAGIIEQADKDVITDGGTVEIKLTVEKQDSPTDAGKIESKAAGQTIGLYLDLSVLKSQLDKDGDLLDETKLTNLGSNLITITFELPDDLKGASNLTIYRVHNNAAEALTATPNAYNETAEIDGDLVTLNVCRFSTYAIAYTPSNPNPPRPPSGGGGSSSGGSSGGTGTTATVSTYWIEVPEAKSMAKSAKEQGAQLARSRRATITGIRKASLLLLSESGLRYQHDTVRGNAVQVRVSVDNPAAATKDILVSGYVTGDAVNKTKAVFEKWFPNKIAVVSFDQQGKFGIKVEIAAKVDLSGMNTSNLYFYSYDKATNKYNRILTEYRIDSNGYLHFATTLAGSIVISDRPLSGSAEPQNPGTGGDSMTWDTSDLQNPNTGGDGNGMITPPTQIDTQNPDTGGSLLSGGTGEPLKLEVRTIPATTDNAGGKIVDAVVFNLDAPITEAADSKKANIWLIGGLGALMLLAAGVLWAVVPRKGE